MILLVQLGAGPFNILFPCCLALFFYFVSGDIDCNLHTGAGTPVVTPLLSLLDRDVGHRV